MSNDHPSERAGRFPDAAGEGSGTKYVLRTLADLLNVPLERRSECMRQLDIALAFCELEYGEAAAEGFEGFEWTDDDDMSVNDLQTGFKLRITTSTGSASSHAARSDETK